MKIDINAQDLARKLRTITDPARRHRCPSCNLIVECHLCTIEVEYVLHSSHCNIPFLCEPCAETMGITSVITEDGAGRAHSEYDYRTGARLAQYRHIHGWNATTGRNGRVVVRRKP